MATIASLLVRIGADVGDFQQAMLSSVRATHDAQLAMEQSSKAVTALEARLSSLRQAYNLGAISGKEFAASAGMLRADVSELATVATMAEGAQGRLAKVGSSAARAMQVGATGVAAAGVTTERAVSRMSFGLAMMAQSGQLGARGLRGVEMGLMSLLPGLGWGLVAVTGLVEGYHLLSQSAEKSAEAFQKFIDKNRVALTATASLADKQRDLAARITELKAALAGGPYQSTFAEKLGDVLKGMMSGTSWGLRAVVEARNARLQEQLDTLNTAKAINQANEARNKAAALAEEHAKRIKTLVEALDRERATFGMSQAQIQLYELRMAGASAATMRHAQTVLAAIDALNKGNEAAKKYAEQLRFAESGLASTESKARSTAEAMTKAYQEHVDRFKEMLTQQKEAAKKHADDMRTIFTDLWGSAVHGNIGGLVETLGRLAISNLFPEGGGKGKPAPAWAASTSAASIAARAPLNLAAMAFANMGSDYMPKLVVQGMPGPARAGHSFQSAVHVTVNSLDAQSTMQVLKKHQGFLAGLVTQGIAANPNLMAYLTGNQ